MLLTEVIHDMSAWSSVISSLARSNRLHRSTAFLLAEIRTGEEDPMNSVHSQRSASGFFTSSTCKERGNGH